MILKEKIDNVRKRIEKAACKSNRMATDITLLCVVKEATIADVVRAIEDGVEDLGENRVQDALLRRDQLSSNLDAIRWHFIGHLQKNKVKKAVRLFDVIHSLDSLDIAEEIDSSAGDMGKIQEVLLQVNVSGEDTKHGISGERLSDFIESIRALENIKVTGLMTLAPYSANPEDSRPHFKSLRALRDRLANFNRVNVNISNLSMGMSGDFEVAIEEGADIVRIGSAIFK